MNLRFKDVKTLGFKGRNRTLALVKGLAMEKGKDKT
jgi:hypothetical protein